AGDPAPLHQWHSGAGARQRGSQSRGYNSRHIPVESFRYADHGGYPGMKYAVFTVSTPTITAEEIAPKLKAIGYDGIEWRIVDEAPNPSGMEFWHGNKATIPFTSIIE